MYLCIYIPIYLYIYISISLSIYLSIIYHLSLSIYLSRGQVHEICAWEGRGPSPWPAPSHPLQSGTPQGMSDCLSQSDNPLTIQDNWLLTAHLPAYMIASNCTPCWLGHPSLPPSASLVTLHFQPCQPGQACCSVIWSTLTNPPAGLVTPCSLLGHPLGCYGCLGFYI
uniref:Uncharacterized protein n=1 Tax=Pipistrellus kuhlii TaxID=59472 RepID=A0A7J8A8P3_PIPKU|nr:hypothetical protein mPipKuh1_008898 [Pipistrellus kuhlii]